MLNPKLDISGTREVKAVSRSPKRRGLNFCAARRLFCEKIDPAARYASTVRPNSALHVKYLRRLLLLQDVWPPSFQRVAAGVAEQVILDGPKSSFSARTRPALNVYSVIQGASRERRKCVARSLEL